MSIAKTALVTGAGAGIGRAVALRFALAGYRVALVGRTAASLEETARLAGTGDTLVLPCDVADEEGVEHAFDRAVAFGSRIDVLFNGAGLFGVPSAFEDVRLADWRGVIDANLTGSFLCARAAFRRMKAQDEPGGRIINCGSVSAQVPRPLAAAYTASKHGITGLTRTIALEGRPHRIACSQLDIGNAATDMTAAMARGVPQADGTIRPEPVMDVGDVADAAMLVAGLPLASNILFMTVMATNMPLVGRG